MAAINYLDENEATLEYVAERYGYTAGWLSRWLDRLERLDSQEVGTTDCVHETGGLTRLGYQR